MSRDTEQINFLEYGHLLQRSCCEQVGCSRRSFVSCVSLLSCSDGWVFTSQAAWRVFSMLLRQLKSTRETERGSTQPPPSPCWEMYFLYLLFPLWCSRMQHPLYLWISCSILWDKLGESHTLRGQLTQKNF